MGEPPPTLSAGAIEEIFASDGRVIYGLGLRLCGNSSDAEDLVQETFLRAFRHRDQFEGRSSPRTWLYTIARRVCQRMHRRRSGEPRRMEPLSELLPQPGQSVADSRALEAGPFREQVTSEARDVVEAALSEMPIQFRMPLVLVDIAEFSIGEAADILGLKPNTVKTRVRRARLKLRRIVNRKLPQLVGEGRPSHSRSVCLDLLTAKMDALDRGVSFPFSGEELCDRCRGVFATLDISNRACHLIREQEMPSRLREVVIAATRRSEQLDDL